MMKYLLAFTLSAAATATAMFLFASDGADPRNSPQLPAQNGQTSYAPKDFATQEDMRLSDLARAMHVLGNVEKSDRPGQRTAGGIPQPETSSPLLDLSIDHADATTRRMAADLRRRLKLSVEQAVWSCWEKLPDPPVWPQFRADLVVRGPATIEVRNLQLQGFQNEYRLESTEASCIATALEGITTLSDVQPHIASLESYLPTAEQVQFEWPCSACR